MDSDLVDQGVIPSVTYMGQWPLEGHRAKIVTFHFTHRRLSPLMGKWMMLYDVIFDVYTHTVTYLCPLRYM